MFYCEECAKRNNYPFEFYLPQSRGPCEICKKTANCVDVPCSRLPDRPGTVTTKNGDELPTEEEERHIHLIRAVTKRFSSQDFDEHIHELKSKEASAINNLGPEEQVAFLIEECGEDWVREVFLPKTDLSELQITRAGDEERHDFDVPLELAKEGIWLTVGKASIHIKHGDDGVGVSIYALHGEMEDALGETWVTHGELEGEDT